MGQEDTRNCSFASTTEHNQRILGVTPDLPTLPRGHDEERNFSLNDAMEYHYFSGRRDVTTAAKRKSRQEQPPKLPSDRDLDVPRAFSTPRGLWAPPKVLFPQTPRAEDQDVGNSLFAPAVQPAPATPPPPPRHEGTAADDDSTSDDVVYLSCSPGLENKRVPTCESDDEEEDLPFVSLQPRRSSRAHILSNRRMPF